MTDATPPIVEFLNRVATALGHQRRPSTSRRPPDGPRSTSTGEEAELLVRHRGEPLKALQHVVDMAFGRQLGDEKRVFVDALDYRKGKDVELRQMAKFLAEKAKDTGRRSAARPAQSVRAPHRAPGGRRSAGRDDREHRRRVLEDGHHLVAEVAARRPGLAAGLPVHGAELRCSPPPTPSSPIATPPGRGGIGVVRLSGPGAHAIARALIAHAATPLQPRHATFTHGPADAATTAASRRRRSGRRDLLSRARIPTPAKTSSRSARTAVRWCCSAIVERGDAPRARGSPSRASSRCARS